MSIYDDFFPVRKSLLDDYVGQLVRPNFQPTSYVMYEGEISYWTTKLGQGSSLYEQMENSTKVQEVLSVSGYLTLDRSNSGLIYKVCQHTNIAREIDQKTRVVPLGLKDNEIEEYCNFVSYFSHLLDRLHQEQKASDLKALVSNFDRSAAFLTGVIKELEESFDISTGDTSYLDFLDSVLAIFDLDLAHHAHAVIQGSAHNKEDNNIDQEQEIRNSAELDGFMWFDLERLKSRWKKQGLTEHDLFYFAENGKLEVCFEWEYSPIGENGICFFKSDPTGKGKVSPLINFRSIAPTGAISELHRFSIDHRNSYKKYSSFAALAPESIKQIRLRGVCQHPTCYVNGKQLLFWFKNRDCEPLNAELKKEHLLVTSREVRRFESENFGQSINSNSEESLSRGAWRTIHILSELLVKEHGYNSREALIAKLNMDYPVTGTSKRSLEDIFAKAKKSMPED